MMKKSIIASMMLCGLGLTAPAQTFNNYQVALTEGRTVVSVDMVFDSLQVPSNRYRAFTPVIRSNDGAHEQRLKSVLVTGRTQEIVFRREGIDPAYEGNCETVRRQKGQAQTVNYTDAILREPWHSGASVYVVRDLCGCGDLKGTDEVLLGTLLPPDPYDLVALTDVVPAAEKKEHSLHGTAYVTFVVNKWDVLPDYMNNRQELRKITDTLDVMVKDPNVSVRQVKIHGWASPESPYAHNKMLAENRARALTDYVRRQYSLSAGVFAPAEATPENWIGLRRAVEALTEAELPHRRQIIGLIDDPTLQPDPKELRIRQLYPQDYQYLLRNVYPGLRRSDYEISFNFSDFTLEQACEVYRTKPYQLSVRELWDVAHTFPEGSDDYNRVLQQAVNIHPESQAALVNLANVAIRQHDLLKAESLLDRAGTSAEALNSRAAVAIVKGQYQEAEQLLQQAAQKGLNVEKNREAIRLLTEMK